MTLSIIAIIFIFFLSAAGITVLSYIINAVVKSMQDGNNVGGRWEIEDEEE